MKDYLRGAMTDLVSRARNLKELIRHPLKYQVLLPLADRCSRLLDDSIHLLTFLLDELEGRDENNIRDIFRGFRSCSRQIDNVEYFGIAALHYETDEINYMNKLVVKIHQEINLPLVPPSVVCTSSGHYSYFVDTNVILVSVGEANFLLHLADLYHEIGHEVHVHRENDLKLKEINEKYKQIIRKITEHYQAVLERKRRETGRSDIVGIIQMIHAQWKAAWSIEFFCDLFALYTLGPAYAWSHFHLTAKKTKDVYAFPKVLLHDHPSDDARMRVLIKGLEILGFDEAANRILTVWESFPLVKHYNPDPDYYYAYPDGLLDEIANTVLQGLQESQISVISQDKLRELDDDSIIRLLNEAWIRFWANPDEFREWETNQILRLKRKYSE